MHNFLHKFLARIGNVGSNFCFEPNNFDQNLMIWKYLEELQSWSLEVTYF